jgi:hypothetical protein
VRRNYSHGQVATPKSGKVRTVPMVAEVRDPDADSAQGCFGH